MVLPMCVYSQQSLDRKVAKPASTMPWPRTVSKTSARGIWPQHVQPGTWPMAHGPGRAGGARNRLITAPCAALTHYPREPLEMKGARCFTSSPTASRRTRAREVRGRKRDVRIGGGVATVRDYLSARLIDELHLSIDRRSWSWPRSVRGTRSAGTGVRSATRASLVSDDPPAVASTSATRGIAQRSRARTAGSAPRSMSAASGRIGRPDRTKVSDLPAAP